ncbi:MarC family protein [Nostoc sp. FACHB-133]|uniref:MarC family protein n=1 Tax=Nostoc sp. FACHB-133 TaxID=2692835 RepID=UPI001689D375|nr:MarC family protein [Nostoc sp. FACHB-133]MBD2527700.1 MarC family protein [Nostoc sp. FACHB-133]
MSLIPNTLATFIALFPIANPIGAVPVFYTLTATETSSERHQQALQTAINVVLVLAVFLVAGRWILEFFGISLNVLRLAGGLLVAHTAWEMVTVRQRLTPSEKNEAMEKEDISFTPMAVPLISGPGAIGVVTSLSISFNHWVEYLESLVGIVLIGISLYLCLVLGEPLIKRLGRNGVGALNRVFGFFILAIGVRFIADGSISLLKEAFPVK